VEGRGVTDYALVFSGQGSERAGMLSDILKKGYGAEETEMLQEHLGREIGSLAASVKGGAAAANNQILLYLYHLIMSKVLIDAIGYPPRVCLGHSFGQLSALANSKAVAFRDMTAFICLRAEVIDRPSIEVKARLRSVHGITLEGFWELQESEGLGGAVELALHNQKEQVVVAATDHGEQRLAELSDRYRYVIRDINVSRPYHTAFMEEYNKALLPFVSAMTFSQSDYPVCVNNSRRLVSDPESFLDEMKIQMVRPVFWYESVFSIASEVGAFVIVDPSDTQAKIIRRITDKKICNVNNLGAVGMIGKRGLRNVG
jgi:[acyl-carrier-protein] S-malonyltransferase